MPDLITELVGMDLSAQQAYELHGTHRIIEAVKISPCGRWLVALGDAGPLMVWELPSTRLVLELPDIRLLAGFSPEGVVVSDGQCTWTQPLPEGPPRHHVEGFAAMARCEEGSLCGLSGQIVQVRTPTGELMRQFPRVEGCMPEEGLSIHAGLVAAAEGGRVRLFPGGDPLTSVSERDVTSVAICPTAPVVAFGTMGGALCLYATRDAEMIFQVPMYAEIRSVAWSPGGSLLAVGLADQHASAVLYPLLRGARLGEPAVVDFGEDCCFAVAFSPDGKLFAAGCRSGKVRLFRLDLSDSGASQALDVLSWRYGAEHYLAVTHLLDGLETSSWSPEQRGWVVFYAFCSRYMLNDTDGCYALRSSLEAQNVRIHSKNLSYCYSLCIELAGIKGEPDAVCAAADTCLDLRRGQGDESGLQVARKVARDTLTKMGRSDLARRYTEPGLWNRVKGLLRH
jgi:WD40 repeat protein